jgi:hypothetical protein
MNLERSQLENHALPRTAAVTCEINSPREALYRKIPRWRELLAAVRAGEAEFVATLAETGLLDKYGKATSTVHPYEDIEGHAFILGIVSDDRWPEVQTKSYLTYASHWIDDFLDCPQRVINPAQLMEDRHDILTALRNMGEVGRIGFAMANRVPHPEAIHKTLHRMLYGGLVQRSKSQAERRALVMEYREIAARSVDPLVVREIHHLQPEAYWASNKSVLEISNAAEQELDFTAAELWNLIYAPALYYQDADEESARGELNFEGAETPQLTEMIRMIRLGAQYLSRMYPQACRADSPQMRQLRFVTRSFRNLPDPVSREYRSLSAGRADACHGENAMAS